MSSGFLNPIDNAQSWDQLYVGGIGGTPSPGYCEWSGFKRAYDWDIKKGKGTKGATTTFTSQPPTEGSFKFYLWLPKHFTQWDAFRPLLKYDPLKRSPKAFDVYHPALADVEVYSCVTKSIGPLTKEGKGLWSVTVELLEYGPPPKKNATATPSLSRSDTTLGVNTTTQDAQQQEIQNLLQQATAP